MSSGSNMTIAAIRSSVSDLDDAEDLAAEMPLALVARRPSDTTEDEALAL